MTARSPKPSALITAAALVLLPAGAMAHSEAGQVSVAAPFGAPVDDEHVWNHVVLDQLEDRFGGDNSSLRWQGEIWIGTDVNRLKLKSEGEWSRDGGVEDGQQEFYYSRPISTYFDILIGGRYDLDAAPGRGWAALGIEGLAPLFFHVSATAYVSDKGRAAAKLEGSYDLLLTQRLILQPEVEMNLYAKDDPARHIGAGLSDIDAGLRLRYEVSRKLAPYIGVTYEKSFGRTAQFVKAEGGNTRAVRFAVGVRAWF